MGANGVIGDNLVEYLLALGDWEVIGLFRRGGVDRERSRYLAVDLLDPADIRE